MPTFTGTSNTDYIYYGYTSSGVTISPTGNYYPTNLVDIIYGNGGSDSLGGYGGDDQIFTGAGNDTAQGGDGNDLIDDFTTSSYGGSDNMDGGAGNDSLYGYTGYDSLYGGDGADWLEGEQDDDVLDGGIGADSMYGGTGSDTYYVDNASDYVEDEAETSYSWDHVYASVSFTLGANIEELTLTGRGTLSGTGNELSNRITGNESANALYGLGGDDTLDGGVGADSLYGGEGSDYLDGETGANYLEGGNGDDTYYLRSASDVATETGAGTSGGTDTIRLSYATSWTLGANFENLDLYDGAVNGTGNASGNIIYGTYSANTLSGLGGNDSLYGYGGSDTLDGGSGNDYMSGGTDNDIYYVDSLGDIIYETYDDYDYDYDEYVYGGTDTVYSTISYTLGDYVENLTLTGTASINGTGNDWDNVITGNSGANALNGGYGWDTLVGGAGNDTYYVNRSYDVVTETLAGSAGGTDLVYADVTYTLSANVENLSLFGTSSIDATGNDLANRITGTTGANYERGLGGNDTLQAGSGNDSLDGGTGADSLVGGAGDDFYYVDNTGDRISETLSGTAGGTDTVYSTATHTLATNVETLYLIGTAAANGTGNALNNAISGNSYVNTLRGMAGNDTFQSGNGADILIGGTGNDVFKFAATTGSTPTARDTIRSGDGAIAFEKAGAALGDRIDLSLVDANTAASGTQHFAFGTAKGIGRLWVSTSGTMTVINGNTDSDATAEFQIAIDDGSVSASAYTSADFILV